METERKLDGAGLIRVMARYEDALERREAHINAINVFPVADADTGTNLLHTVAAARADGPDSGSLPDVAAALSAALLMAGRGASGLILSQALIGLCSRLTAPVAEAAHLADACKAAGLAAIDAVVDPVEGTMLTAAKRAGYAAEVSAALGAGSTEVARAARDAAWRSVSDSPKLLDALRSAGVVDSGAVGYALFLDVLVEELDGREAPRRSLPLGFEAEQTAHLADRYEVVAELSDPTDLAALRSSLGAVGSAVGVSADGDRANVHVHTDELRIAIEHLGRSGAIDQIEISDLVRPQPGTPETVVVAVEPWDAFTVTAAGARRALAPVEEGRLMQILESVGDVVVIAVGSAADAVLRVVEVSGLDVSVDRVPSISDAIALLGSSND